jgi:hypothetical protein
VPTQCYCVYATAATTTSYPGWYCCRASGNSSRNDGRSRTSRNNICNRSGDGYGNGSSDHCTHRSGNGGRGNACRDETSISANRSGNRSGSGWPIGSIDWRGLLVRGGTERRG